MYNEDSFKSHLFWIQIKRIFFMIVFSIMGSVIGVLISSYLVDILLFNKIYRIIIVTISTLIFFAISLLVTANTGKEVQDGYWKIAVLRKLTLISKKLDSLENLDKLETFLNLETFQNKETNTEQTSKILPKETSNEKKVDSDKTKSESLKKKTIIKKSKKVDKTVDKVTID